MSEGLKKGGVEKTEKEEVSGATGEEEVKEGPSVEVKQEDIKEPADIKPDTENLTAVEPESNSKPAGEKYTPKVRLSLLIYCVIAVVRDLNKTT